MSITVFEALQLPIMQHVNLRAGHEGVNAPIKWVTIVEVIEDTTRLQEGEFLITTAYGLAEDTERQKIFIEQLAKQKISALAIQTGFYLHAIPTQFIEAANRFQLPLFELPSNINFSMITKEILQQVINRQFEIMEYSEDIHRKLIQLVLANGGLPSIAQLLATWTSGGVLITNHNYEIMADACPFLASEEKLNLLERTQERIQKCNLDEKYYVTLTPIIANESKLGYLIVIKENEALEELDKLAIGQTAIVCALEFLKILAVKDTEQRLRGDFLEELLLGNFSSKNAMIEKAKTFGYDLTTSHAVTKIKLDHIKDLNLRHQVEYEIAEVIQKEVQNYILKHRHNALLILMETDPSTPKSSEALMEKIAETWNKLTHGLPIHIGIGNTYNDVTLLVQSAQQAEKAIKYSPILLKNKGITYYQDLVPYYLIMEMIENGVELSSFYQPTLQTLLAYDHSHNSDLVNTLEMFLYENMNIQRTSAALYIHRHTLKYRLEKIKKLTGKDMNDYHNRLQLQFALISYKLDQAQIPFI